MSEIRKLELAAEAQPHIQRFSANFPLTIAKAEDGYSPATDGNMEFYYHMTTVISGLPTFMTFTYFPNPVVGETAYPSFTVAYFDFLASDQRQSSQLKNSGLVGKIKELLKDSHTVDYLEDNEIAGVVVLAERLNPNVPNEWEKFAGELGKVHSLILAYVYKIKPKPQIPGEAVY